MDGVLTCEQARLDLFVLLHEELKPEEESRLRRHLSGCPACRKEQEEMTGVLEVLDQHYPTLSMSEQNWSRLETRIRKPYWPTLLLGGDYPLAVALITAFGGLCLAWLLRINARVVEAFGQTLQSLDLEAQWLTEGPVSSFLAPLLFILLCALLTLLLSPLIMKPTLTGDAEKSPASPRTNKIS